MPSLKPAYLTIDDSPSADFLQKLDALTEREIPAVFFCIGQLMKKRPEWMIECIRRGYLIGNHSYTHPHFSKKSLDKCRQEILQTDCLIDELYEAANVARPCKWFRFPYGDKGDGRLGVLFDPKRTSDAKRQSYIQSVLLDLGYEQPAFPKLDYQFMITAGLLDDVDWHWSFDVMEWATMERRPTFGIRGKEQVFNRLQETAPPDCRGETGPEKRWLQSTSAEIILLHDHEQTTPLFEPILDQLLDLPLQFASFDPLLIG